MDNLVGQLYETIKDYRTGTAEEVNLAGIERWISQFDRTDQPFILKELTTIFQRLYVSKQRAIDGLERFFQAVISEFAQADPQQFASKARLLVLEKDGRSQEEICTIANELVREKFGVELSRECDSDKTIHIILDDVIITGNKMLSNIKNWIEREKPTNCQLLVFALILDERGQRYLQQHLDSLAFNNKLSTRIDSIIWFNRDERILATRHFDDPAIQSYQSRISNSLARLGNKMPVFCPPPATETLFSSPESRLVVERAFLQKGVLISDRIKRRYIGPLGFSKLIGYGLGFGFGTISFPYRNCPNTSPLVLWASANGWHPLVKRYDPGWQPPPDPAVGPNEGTLS